jgi:hypothetical protein
MGSDRDDADLIVRYVATFGIFNDLNALGVSVTLHTGCDERGWARWQPRRWVTAPSALASLYHGLGLAGEGGSRFPQLYEQLLLSYRWAEVDLGRYRLMANEPADDKILRVPPRGVKQK